MKKKISIIVVFVVIFVFAMVLTGCGLFNFGDPFDKLTKHAAKKGTANEADGSYVITHYDSESDSVLKIIAYTAEGEEKICLQMVGELGDLTITITKEIENYKWVYIDEDYGEVVGHINLDYNYDSTHFVVFEDFGEVPEELQSLLEELIEPNVQLCLLEFELYLIDNYSSLSVSDFGIKMIV